MIICSSLTFENVRRVLEKDLGLETHDLDTHKRFIKQCVKTVLFNLPFVNFLLFDLLFVVIVEHLV